MRILIDTNVLVSAFVFGGKAGVLMNMLFESSDCAMTLLSSCTKEEDKLDDRLVGTKWQTRDNVHEWFYGGICYQVYEFVSTIYVEKYTTRNGNVDDSDGSFNYELNYPNITIHEFDSDGKPNDQKFVFTDSRTMQREGTTGNDYYQRYLKQ